MNFCIYSINCSAQFVGIRYDRLSPNIAGKFQFSAVLIVNLICIRPYVNFSTYSVNRFVNVIETSYRIPHRTLSGSFDIQPYWPIINSSLHNALMEFYVYPISSCTIFFSKSTWDALINLRQSLLLTCRNVNMLAVIWISVDATLHSLPLERNSSRYLRMINKSIISFVCCILLWCIHKIFMVSVKATIL